MKLCEREGGWEINMNAGRKFRERKRENFGKKLEGKTDR